MRRAFLGLLGWALSAFGHPVWVPWLGVVASAAGLALFWRAIQFLTFKRQFWASVLWFASVQALQIGWLAEPAYMGPLIYGLYALLCLGMGLQFGALTFWVMRGASPFSAAGFWVLMEWSRLLLFTGFPWNPLGFALAGNPLTLQFAALFGVYGMSFWVVWVNALAFAGGKKKGWMAAFLFPWLAGAISFGSASLEKEALSVAFVQPGLLPDQKCWDPKRKEAFIPPIVQWARALSSMRALPERVDLLLFPEAAFPYGAFRPLYPVEAAQSLWGRYAGNSPPLPLEEAALSNGILAKALGRKWDADVIVGLDEEIGGSSYNAAFFFQREKEDVRYDKRILMPVAEYIPLDFIPWIPSFIQREFGIKGSFCPGEEAKVFSGKKKFGVAICSEEVYSSFMHETRQKGAEVFVTLNNDAWFPKTKLPYVHLMHAKLRAVENGVPLLRSCNTGLSAALDCRGSVLASLPVDEGSARVLFAKVPLETRKTPYSLWGDAAIFALSLFLSAPLARVALNRDLSLP